ncbi:MAG: translation elongation factor Ts, partial [Alphaproteobacteria bacterium]|nr:translation elongation factor Ts [Alphaproteobacteria bacterium]
MAEISATMVKELREKTGAGMMDCKRALGETAGNLEEAVDWLRKKGLAAASKKAGRVASEGLVGVYAEGKVGTVVEINAETDFVARNEAFQKLVADVAKLVVTVGDDIGQLSAAPYPGAGHSVADEITRLIATIGENMSLRRAKRFTVSHGIVATYMHGALVPNLGKIGVLVAMESAGDAGKLAALG